MALTDKKAIIMALHMAIDYEQSFIDSYRNNSEEPAVQASRKHIAAFRRVLARYFPSRQKTPMQNMIDTGLADGSLKMMTLEELRKLPPTQTFNVMDLLKGKIDDRD
ncbi:hypothetical protein P10VF_255 [Rhizobium phage vB_RleM_P10VF]|uniref:Uncharacterized protein n=1 Tax=Rhizobium phage vB_RleM_P10VF TaxID=1527770 RepID=A0A076YJ09_9CAUD|nr:hypothetical protein P10VF_255 [Rhizobium phage vB_RleM_P10VF]AIK68468.1 hypothetical protein P10VF_255 [Rhizobium phage vB_RleM_P10VF]